MKKSLIFLLPLILCCGKTEKIDCENFKYGKFVQNLEELNMKVYSERTKDGFQRDSTKFGISKYKLIWKSECDLESKLIETNIERSKKHIGRTYYVNIIKTLSKSSYIYKCHIKEYDFVDIDTIIKVQ